MKFDGFVEKSLAGTPALSGVSSKNTPKKVPKPRKNLERTQLWYKDREERTFMCRSFKYSC